MPPIAVLKDTCYTSGQLSSKVGVFFTLEERDMSLFFRFNLFLCNPQHPHQHGGNLILTGYKIKDDRICFGTFIMSYIALVTHISKYNHMYHSVRLTENTISPLFIIYFTS